MAKREIIFRSDHLTVVYSESGSKTVFVTFNERGMPAKGDSYWGSKILEDLEVSAIGFMSARENWYPIADMISAIDKAKACIHGRTVITYGHSQGGYGALKFGKSLSASLAVGFSPQWSIDPLDVSAFDMRFTAYHDPLLRNGERIEQHDLCPRNFIFFDPLQRQDAAQAGRLLAMDNVKGVVVPFSGHSTVAIVSQGGVGRALLQLCIKEANVTGRDFRSLIRTARSRSITYAQEKAGQLEASVSRHRRFIHSAIEAMPSGPARTLASIRVYLACNELLAAAGALDGISDADLLRTDFLNVWRSFRVSGFTYGEARLAPLFKTRYKDSIFSRLHAVNSFVHIGDRTSALLEIQELAAMRGACVHIGQFVHFYRLLDCLEHASALMDGLEQEDRLFQSDRIKIGFDLLALYRLRGMQPEMLHELMRLGGLCRDDTALSIRLIEEAIGAGQFGFASDQLKLMPELAEQHPVMEVYAARCAAAKDPFGAAEHLKGLLKRNIQDYEYWQKLSIAAEHLFLGSQALEASKKAVQVAASDKSAEALHRHVMLLLNAGMRRAAAKNLRRLVGKGAAKGHLGGSLANLAVRAQEPLLAEHFMREWLAANPGDFLVELICCKIRVDARKMAEAAEGIEKMLTHLSTGYAVSKEHLMDLIACAQAVDYALERRVVTLALTRYPEDPDFHMLARSDRDAFAAKFSPASSAGAQPPPKRRFVSRLPLLGRWV